MQSEADELSSSAIAIVVSKTHFELVILFPLDE